MWRRREGEKGNGGGGGVRKGKSKEGNGGEGEGVIYGRGESGGERGEWRRWKHVIKSRETGRE